MEKKKILVIDDEPQIRELLKMFIETNSGVVDEAGSVEDALSKIRSRSYDMVLLDIMLPDGNGLDVLKQVKQINPLLPVVMITGGSDIKVAEECLANGAVDYITKPFDFEYLRTSILVNTLI